MNLQTLLEEKNITMYRLSKISGVPKTTIIDICSGKSSIEGCSAKTVYKIAQALNCSMEDLMKIDTANYDLVSGKPKDNAYLEKGIPEYLVKSIETMERSWKIEDSGQKDYHWDLYWCELSADINMAETEQEITSEQAWYLRHKYLRIKE